MGGTIKWDNGESETAHETLTLPVNPNPGTGGTLTITGIPAEYNGKYALCIGVLTMTPQVTNVIAAKSFNFPNVTADTISNGSVTSPTWGFNQSTNVSTGKYTGNDTNITLDFMIYNSPPDLSFNGSIASVRFNSVTFSNGSVTKAWSDGTYAPMP